MRLIQLNSASNSWCTARAAVEETIHMNYKMSSLGIN